MFHCLFNGLCCQEDSQTIYHYLLNTLGPPYKYSNAFSTDYVIMNVDCKSQNKYHYLLNTHEPPCKCSKDFSTDYALMKVDINSQTKYSFLLNTLEPPY